MRAPGTLRPVPKRERYLFVCENRRADGDPKGSCARRGSTEIKEKLKELTVERGMRKKVRVCGATCLDLCWVGVSIGVMPDNVFYGNVTLADVPEIVDALEKGTLVDRLVLPPNLFDDPKKEK